MGEYDDRIERQLDVKDKDIDLMEIPQWNRLSIDEDDPEFLNEFEKIIQDDEVPEADDISLGPREDSYINMEIGVPKGDGGELLHATVKQRVLDGNGRPVGTETMNPITDTRLYEIEFIDGSTEVMAANVIAENLLSQVDQEGHRQLMLDEITNHRKTASAIPIEDGTYITSHRATRRKITTKGWEIFVQWKDGSSNWVALKDMKNLFPIELADYAVNNGLASEPAFAWWVPHTLKKRKSILGKIKSKYWQRTHKYGVRIPKSVSEAHECDKENGDTSGQMQLRRKCQKSSPLWKSMRERPATSLVINK